MHPRTSPTSSHSQRIKSHYTLRSYTRCNWSL